MMQVASRYTDGGKGDMEGTGSNGEDLQMYTFVLKTQRWNCYCYFKFFSYVKHMLVALKLSDI